MSYTTPEKWNGGTTLIVANTWVFVCITWNNGIYNSYVNGLLDGTQSMSPFTIPYSALPLRIGSANNVAGQFFKGKIDDIRIYNRALSESEIQALYNE